MNNGIIAPEKQKLNTSMEKMWQFLGLENKC